MNGLWALTPIALAVITILLGWAYLPTLIRAARQFFSYPAYGDTPLCLRCAVPLPSSSTHFCPECGTPLTGFAATDPILRIATTGVIYRRIGAGTQGVALFGVVVLLTLPLGAVVATYLDTEAEGSAALALGAVPWLLVYIKGAIRTRYEESGV